MDTALVIATVILVVTAVLVQLERNARKNPSYPYIDPRDRDAKRVLHDLGSAQQHERPHASSRPVASEWTRHA